MSEGRFVLDGEIYTPYLGGRMLLLISKKNDILYLPYPFQLSILSRDEKEKTLYTTQNDALFNTIPGYLSENTTATDLFIPQLTPRSNHPTQPSTLPKQLAHALKKYE
jgi:hypothetical protein